MMFKGIDICCPHCRGDLSKSQQTANQLHCLRCDNVFPIIFDIPDLRVFSDPYISMEADREKGLRVAARFNELNFSELVEFYYSITSVVPAKDARQYKRGLMAGVARTEAALDSWEGVVGTDGRSPAVTLLDVGCGTAPLLVTAASRYQTLVGVDVAFRWLVVAKKRLAEAKMDLPLICACAEALPFRDGAFDRVVIDSVVEHFRDQPRALAECYRVMRPNGYLYFSTPNRFSLGPDPHMGLWAGGYLPDRWVAAYVRWQGGIPPKRRLLSPRSLTRLLREAAFRLLKVYLPDVPPAQRSQFGKGLRCLIDLYQIAKGLPLSRQVCRWIGPSLHAVAQKPDESFRTDVHGEA